MQGATPESKGSFDALADNLGTRGAAIKMVATRNERSEKAKNWLA
jgi:hypothetical protein